MRVWLLRGEIQEHKCKLRLLSPSALAGMSATHSVLTLTVDWQAWRAGPSRRGLATLLDLQNHRSGASAGPASSQRINHEALKTSGGTWKVAAMGFQQSPPWGRVCPHKAVSTCLNWHLISRH